MGTLFIIKNLDWKLNFAILFLVAASLVSLASTAPNLFYKQILWIVISLVLTFLIIKVDWRPFINYRSVIFILYFLGIAALLGAYFFSPAIRGAKSWLTLIGLRFEPSEFMKAALIILYALFFSRRHASIARISNLIVSFIYFLVPGILIAIQPDFGASLILFSIWLGFLLISGIKWRHLVVLIIIFSLLGVVIWQSFLKDYQKQRVLGFLFPGRDPLGTNYNVIQAKIAIGSAGLLGKGFRQGTQSQLGFLPERQTDFIFAAVVEEWGLVSGLFLVMAWGAIIFEIIKIGLDSQKNFNRFVCLGTAMLFITQFALNIGSNLGLTPVVGVTYPFLSYGGSSLLTNFILVAIIQSIFVRRSL